MKIEDNVTLRQVSLEYAIEFSKNEPKCWRSREVVEVAERFAAYLKGDAELPEHKDDKEYWQEILKRFDKSAEQSRMNNEEWERHLKSLSESPIKATENVE